jgi:predicted transposase/invertase (TIGR01784 family)
MKDKLVTAPSIDAIFKAIFERNLDCLQDFLSLVMDVDVNTFDSIKVTNPGLTPEQIGDKFAVLDMLVVMDSGEKINVEMQNYNEGNYKERSVFNCSKVFSKDLKAGDDYSDLRKTVCINVMQFPLFKGSAYHSTVYPIIKETGEIVTDLWQIHYFETPKIPYDPHIRLEYWLEFFTVKTKEELDMVRAHNDVMINKAIDAALLMNKDDYMREVARQRENRRVNEATALSAAWREGNKDGINKGIDIGIEKGIDIGINKGIDIGRNESITELVQKMLAYGMSMDTIKHISGLSEKEILALK